MPETTTAPSLRAPCLGAPRLRVLGWLVSAAALAGVVIWALGEPPPPAPKYPSLIPVAVTLYAVATFVRGERWRLLLRFDGATASRVDCQALVCVGYMGNNVLPARAGDAMRVVYMTPRSGVSTRTVIGTLVAERVLDVTVLFSLYAVLAGVLGAGTLSADRFLFAVAAIGVLLIFAAIAAVLAHRGGHLARG